MQVILKKKKKKKRISVEGTEIIFIFISKVKLTELKTVCIDIESF